MIRKMFMLSTILSSCLIAASQVSAQAVVPDLQPFPRIQVPRIEGLPPELQQEFDKIQEEIDQVFNQGFPQPNQRPTGASALTWGGMQLKKVAADEQEKLGLPENEGMVVTVVAANSNAAKAGVKANDVLVKINQKAVTNDATAFAKRVKDQNAAEPIDLIVLRNGKEETIKGAQMPAIVQMPAARPNPAFGGLRIRPMPLMIPGARINGRIPFQDGLLGKPQNLNMQMVVNGAKISKKQNGDDFSGEYSKDELRITVAGKLENGVARPSEITVQDGKETNKYKAVNEVPAGHRSIVQQLLPVTIENFFFPFQQLQDLQFPGLPIFPGIDN